MYDYVYSVCEKNSFDYKKSMEQLSLDKNNIGKFSKVVDICANIIKDKIPYSLFLEDKELPTFETMVDIVKTIEGNRVDNVGNYHTVEYLNFKDIRKFVKSDLDKLNRLIEESHCSNIKLKIEYNGLFINLKKSHIVMFKNESCECVVCNVKVRYVTLEKSNRDSTSKLILWAVGQDNIPVRMTVDHKVAYRMGGTNNFENLVSMCNNCNSKKSSIESQYAQHKMWVNDVRNGKIYPFQVSWK